MEIRTLMTINCDYSKHGAHRFGKCSEYNLEPRRLLTKVDVTAVAVSINRVKPDYTCVYTE